MGKATHKLNGVPFKVNHHTQGGAYFSVSWYPDLNPAYPVLGEIPKSLFDTAVVIAKPPTLNRWYERNDESVDKSLFSNIVVADRERTVLIRLYKPDSIVSYFKGDVYGSKPIWMTPDWS